MTFDAAQEIAELGRKYAKDNAVDKLFELEAYRIVHNKMTAKE